MKPPTDAVEPYCGLDPAAYTMLLQMLQYRRPAGSKHEQKFINRFLRPLNPKQDDYGNLYVTVGDNPTVLWSCHTDTVHRSSGRQIVKVDHEGFAAPAPTSRHSNCLGADCTTGVWLMVQMIMAGKPGLYVFHRAEEVGCLGSGWIAANNADRLAGIKYAIAFDRYGYDHVITHQAFGRCCSDDFAYALAGQLGGSFRPDDTGVYTDTNEYVGIIPECTNISVGYFQQHTKAEVQSVEFLAYLLPALLALDVDALPCVRDPAIYEDDLAYGYGGRYGSGKGYSRRDDDEGFFGYSSQHTSMEAMCRYYPDEVAEVLRAYGVSEDDLAAEIYNQTGSYPY
jgi:hypothetical protein